MNLKGKAYAEHAHLAAEAMQWLDDCILHWDTDFRCVAANRESTLNFSGLNSHFLLGQRLSDLPLAEAVKDSMRHAFALALEQPGKTNTLFHRVSMNQKVYELQTDVVCERVNDLPVGFLSITKRPQSPVMSAIAFWKAAFEPRNDFWLCVDVNGRIFGLSDGIRKRHPQLLDIFALGEALSQNEQKRLLLSVKDHLARKREHSFFLNLDGVDYKARTIDWPGFGNESFISLMLEDTSKKSILHRKEEARAALINAALTGIEDDLILYGKDGQILFLNGAPAKLFPEKMSTLADLVPHWEGRLFSASNNSPMEVRELAGFLVLEGEPRVSDRFVLRKQSETVVVESQAQEIRASKRGEAYVMWLLRDVSKEEERLSRLREVNRRMDLFVRAASHDLRIPMSNIRNLAKLMQFAKNDESRTHFAKRIEEAGDLLYELFEGIAQLAAVKTEEKDEAELLSVSHILDEVLKTLDLEMTEGGISLKLELEVTELTYKKSFLRSILFNLLTNAVKYRGTERPEIRIATRPADRGIWLIVQDNGMGMDLKKRGHDLFKPFSRLTEKGSGHGLGLSLVKSFVEQNGGEVHVESELGKGTRFKLLLRSYANDNSQYALFD